ncbi:RagB/SusD family nutrient uptake outer membrane protein [Myroides indicus]|uniref:Putative outer membrane starch-binding protein n=1 Tax=Myroides indicus TaxID=1323422 RepID=A0A4R7F052_9FLAO|nr:RagB/SusD family nutrient uptake outer membrane protein [Myroides indicus]TDS56523.1 putative outer membrane starch-binding protein [Myroides indicus]
MKNKYFILFNIRYLYFIVLLLSIQSCEKLVEIDLPNNQINTEDVFKDINTTKSALANLYSNVRETRLFRGGTLGASCNLDLYTDNMISFGQNNPFYTNFITAADIDKSFFWSLSFTDIYAINTFIERLSASSYIEENNKKVFLGEAYLLRALYHQYLTQLFGAIPYVTSTDYKINSAISKIPVGNVLESSEGDLKSALALLPQDYRHPEHIYPNRAVAELLLAQNYLLQKQYVLAEQTAKAVIANPLFKMESDLNKVFKKQAKSTLWQISTETYSTYDADYIFNTLPPTRVVLQPNLVNTFSEQDLRFQNWIKEVTDGTTSYYHAYKYKNKENNTDEYSIVFRIEEAYFILMEALAYQNRTAEAVHYLNLIRHRAGLLPLPETLSKEEFINEMLSESRREFFTEGGHRFFDLKRNNKLHILKTVKPNWEDKHALLPIPEGEILLNPNLLPQNNGY